MVLSCWTERLVGLRLAFVGGREAGGEREERERGVNCHSDSESAEVTTPRGITELTCAEQCRGKLLQPPCETWSAKRRSGLKCRIRAMGAIASRDGSHCPHSALQAGSLRGPAVAIRDCRTPRGGEGEGKLIAEE